MPVRRRVWREDAEAVAALANDDGPYVLVAHSYGGAVAAEVGLANTKPSKVHLRSSAHSRSR